jgi:acetyl-CoA carboxylase carboxyl transferase subunit alpha
MTAPDLKELGIIDQILPEPVGGAHSDPLTAASILKEALLQNLEALAQMTPVQRRELRYHKFRNIGVFTELPAS